MILSVFKIEILAICDELVMLGHKGLKVSVTYQVRIFIEESVTLPKILVCYIISFSDMVFIFQYFLEKVEPINNICFRTLLQSKNTEEEKIIYD